jgi:hypothetical protein
MSVKAERFKARKSRMQSAQQPNLTLLPTPAARLEARRGVDAAFLAEIRRIDDPVDWEVGHAEVEALLQQLRGTDSERRFDQLLADCKTSVAQSIAGPFGMGAVVAQYDKVGGNVDTVHNVRDGVYAKESERDQFNARGDYKTKAVKRKYHQAAGYIRKNAKDSKAFKENGVADAYRNADLKKSRRDKKQLDHTRSAHDIHHDPAAYLAELDAAALAAHPDNLNSTAAYVNNHKDRMTGEEFIAHLNATGPKRREEIETLRSKGQRTPQDEHRLKNLQQLEEVDFEKVREAQTRADRAIDGSINKKYYRSKKFTKNVAKTSFNEAKKMAFQQAIGTALSEFFLAAIDEIRDWYKSGRGNLMLGERLKRIGMRVAKSWKRVLTAAAQGALAGFLSNLATVLVNVFVTTQARAVRMIREGFMSLVRAVKTLVLRPEGMTFAEAAHAATKVAFAGGIVIGGIVLEELIIQQLQALGLGLVAGVATAVIVGSVTGIVTALVTYSLDKLDLFGVEAKERGARLQQTLDADVERSAIDCEAMLVELEHLLPQSVEA